MSLYYATSVLVDGSRITVAARGESGRAAASLVVRYASVAFADRWNGEWPSVERRAA